MEDWKGFEHWDFMPDGRMTVRQLSQAEGGVKNHIGLLRLGIRTGPKATDPQEFLQVGISPSGAKQLHDLLGRMLDTMGVPKESSVQ